MEVQSIPDVTTIAAVVPRGFIRLYNGSGASIPRGKWVAEDLSVTTFGVGTAIKISTAATGGGGILGIAAETIPDGSWGLVQFEGIFEGDASIDSANVAAGSLLAADATTAGRATIISGAYAATHLILGRVLVDDTDDTGTVRLFNPGGLRSAGGND